MKIIGDERPDNVGPRKVYDNDDLDWIILISNNIIDINNEWTLLTQFQLNEFLSEIYTTRISEYSSL